MGQGTYQSIPALIAEELELAPDQYTVKQSGGEAQFGPMQFSGGSFSVRASYMDLRKVGAAAREMLISAASKQWGVPASECYAENAKIIHKPSGKSLGYGDLVETASKLEAPKEPKLKDPKDFKILGKSIKRSDIPLKSSGKAVFGIDVDVPNMVYASVERCPVFGAKLINFDKAAALKVTGVEQVIEVERDVDGKKYMGVAVVAKNYWAATKGRKVLNVKWDFQGNDSFNTKDYFQSLRDGLKNEGLVQHSQGDFDKTYSASTNQVESVYETPFVSHNTMEPMNCVAHWKEGDKLEIWASTQAPSMVMGDFPKRFGLKAEDIKLNVTFNGGGFGRRLNLDFIVEAVNLSKTIKKTCKTCLVEGRRYTNGTFPPTYVFSDERLSFKRWEIGSFSTQSNSTYIAFVGRCAR